MVESLQVERIFVILSGVLFVSIKCENCAFAPACPDMSTWKPGFICENNLIPIIKTRYIDGLKKKTICCRAINSKCNEQFWCKPQNSNNQVLMENSSLPTRTSCSSGCSPIWKEFRLNSSNLHDGVRAGSFSPGISSFIGRTLVNGELQIGRIQISHPTGLYYTFDGSVRFTNSSFEYLEDSSFNWQNSSNGDLVRNAVTVTAVKNLPFYIGRIQVNGFSYIGTVVRVLGLMYYGDENGIERTTDCYEVLTCQMGNGGEDMTEIVDNPEEMATSATNIDFEVTTSSLHVVTEFSAQNSSNSDQQSILTSTDHSGTHLGSFSTSLSTELPNSIQNSSQISIIVDETIAGSNINSSGYSYNPPLISLSLTTSTELSQGVFTFTESSTSQSTTTKSPNSLIEAATAHKPSNISTSLQSTPASSSQNASQPSTTQSSTFNPISMHSWTQVPPFALNGSTLMQSMSQMSSISSSTEKVSATITAENNNEVHNVNVGEQIGLEQLTSSVDGVGNGEGNLGGNLWSNVSGIGGDFGMNVNEKPNGGNSSSNGEILGQVVGNQGQLVVENEGGIEGLGSSLYHNQVTSTEKAENEFSEIIDQTTENVGIDTEVQNIHHSGGLGHLGPESSSQNPATQSLSTSDSTISQTMKTKSTRTTTKASNNHFEFTEFNSFPDLTSLASTSTEVSNMSSTSDILTASTEPIITRPTKPQEYVSITTEFTNTSPVNSVSTNTVSETSNSNMEQDFSSTESAFASTFSIPGNNEEFELNSTVVTTDEPEDSATTTQIRLESTTDASETSELNLVLQNTPTTESASIATYSTFSISSSLEGTELSSTVVNTEVPTDSTSSSTQNPIFELTTDSPQEFITDPVKYSTTKAEELQGASSKFTSRSPFSTFTPRSTTSRTTRTKYTRSTTTKRTSTIELQNGDDMKPSWLFNTQGTTESVNQEQISDNKGDMTTSTSTEVTEVNNVKEMFECVPHWKQLSPKSSFLFDGIEITSQITLQSTNFLSYIGQITINNTQILGKINLKPQNLPTFSYYFNNSIQVSTTDTITYLSTAQLQNYSWKVSSKGLAVKNAISINQTGNWPYYIGRIKSNGVILIGKVLPSIGLVYADKYGNEKISKAYEVLTCETMVDEGGGCGIRSWN